MTPDVSGRAAELTPSRRARWARRGVCGLYAALIVTAVVTPGARFPAIAAGIGLFGLLALVFGVGAATRRALPGPVRRAWWLLSSGFLLLNLVPLGIAWSKPVAGGAASGIAAAPSLGDALRLLAVLPMLAALMSFPRSHTTRRDNYKLLLDVLTVIGGSFMLIWYFVLGPVTTAQLPVITMVVSVAYPVGDLALIFGATVVVLRGAHLATRRPMTILLVGLSTLVVADTYLGYCKINPGIETYPLLQLAILMTGLFLLALAGLEQCVLATATHARQTRHRPATTGSRLPYAALAAGSTLLIVEALRSDLYPWGGLIAGGVVMTSAVAVRQFVAMRENHTLIVSDSLTGLANRVRLQDALSRAVDRANHTGERTAVMLIDMDGFKQINDTLGHSAGDQLLVGFATLLRESVLGADVVARLGGDEFAIVLRNVGVADNAGAVASRIITRMRQPIAVNGEPVCPAASIGIALTEPGVPAVPSDLLRRADMAMYQAKAEQGNTYRFFAEDSTAAHAAGRSMTPRG